MSVIYMFELENEPESYEKYFSSLTKGTSKHVQELILKRIQPGMRVLEVGCGPGTLSLKLAEKKANVIAYDTNFKMVIHAMKSIRVEHQDHVKFQIGSATELPEDLGKFDAIITTFMLFELRPLEQQIFLRYAWNHLNPNGHLIIADEFVPNGIWKLNFYLKRFWYKKKMKVQRTGISHPLKWFLNYLDRLKFEIKAEKQLNHGAIRIYDCVKKKVKDSGYYRPIPFSFNGIKAKLRIARCLLTGQIDHVAIEPGIYESGSPSEDSPIIVTANYTYTFIKVMNDLKGIDAWVLCLDSNGINVWCAARGNNFGNTQLIEAIRATGIQKIVSHDQLILPQLAAGGVSVPNLPNDFPFKIKFGPIWSKSLKTYIKEMPKQKSDEMRIAKFTTSKRLEAGITHTTFLLRKFFLLPSILASIVLLILFSTNISFFQDISLQLLALVGWIFLSIIITNLVIAFGFPLANFARSFIIKGLIFGSISALLGTLLYWFIFQSVLHDLANGAFLFWLGYFSTMSFSGYTPFSSPRQIKYEYSRFSKINKFLLILMLTIIIFVIIIDLLMV